MFDVYEFVLNNLVTQGKHTHNFVRIRSAHYIGKTDQISISRKRDLDLNERMFNVIQIIYISLNTLQNYRYVVFHDNDVQINPESHKYKSILGNCRYSKVVIVNPIVWVIHKILNLSIMFKVAIMVGVEIDRDESYL